MEFIAMFCGMYKSSWWSALVVVLWWQLLYLFVAAGLLLFVTLDTDWEEVSEIGE